VKRLDRFLQRWRIDEAAPYVKRDARVLDVGCADGALFDRLGPLVGEGVGIDPDLRAPEQRGALRLVPGRFPDDLDVTAPFDVITMLAVFEHVPGDQQAAWARACHRLLAPGGALVITTPSPLVDPILDVLLRLRIADGMSLEQHRGFDPREAPRIFLDVGFTLETWRRFQLGLNHLFVFRKP
jgi:2-polyprenyl-3-methyl-5-hydroxy-6-metoxy-1,4-benzoquinol methylase